MSGGSIFSKLSATRAIVATYSPRYREKLERLPFLDMRRRHGTVCYFYADQTILLKMDTCFDRGAIPFSEVPQIFSKTPARQNCLWGDEITGV